MAKVKLRVKTLAHFLGELPSYQTALASGMDIRAQISEPLIIQPMQRVLVPSGLQFEIPPGFEIQVRPRSGLAAKQGLTVLNSPGTVDADYRGEVKVILVNLGQETLVINPQDRMAQLILAPVVQAELELVSDLSETHRGGGGFGSTGIGEISQ